MSLTVRVVAPVGRDAKLIVQVLQHRGISAEAVDDALGLLDAASCDPLGPLLIAEESLAPAVIHRLTELVHHQPAWSDLPILILTTGGRSASRSQRLEEQHLKLGSPVLLERPIRTETMVSNLRAAVRARARQYEVRDALMERDRALEELRSERDILRNSEDRFRRVIENASVCINISDIQGHISYGNPALLRLIGYTAEEVEQGLVRWDELTPAEFAELDRHATEQLLTTGTCTPYQKAYRARDGRLIPLLVGMTILPSMANEPSQVAVFLTDLSSQKLAEAALVQSEKLAAVGRLAASISHEINNPLEAVTNILYLIQKEDSLSQETLKHLVLAERELARVSQITTQTLRFHRQATNPREVSPQELIQPVIDLYHGRLLNSQIEIVCQHRGAQPFSCYEGDLRQVLNNLVGNAIESMRTGGKLVVRTRDGTFWRTGVKGVRITIGDTGSGMSSTVREHIFEAFYTTKDINGTGLGLWISKGIIEKHHGALEVKSRDRPPHTGSVFSLFLPRDPLSEAADGSHG